MRLLDCVDGASVHPEPPGAVKLFAGSTVVLASFAAAVSEIPGSRSGFPVVGRGGGTAEFFSEFFTSGGCGLSVGMVGSAAVWLSDDDSWDCEAVSGEGAADRGDADGSTPDDGPTTAALLLALQTTGATDVAPAEPAGFSPNRCRVPASKVVADAGDRR
jgi:hypothetical protein